MRLASRSQYAITAMLELGLADEKHPVPLLELAHKLNISLSYMEQLFARLREKRLVVARRGPGGGYKLSRPMRDIMVSDIVCAVEDISNPSQPSTNLTPPGSGNQVSGRELWKDLSKQVYTFLNGISLAQIMEQETDHGASAHTRTLDKGASPTVV